jgi:predicted phosphodiesterase
MEFPDLNPDSYFVLENTGTTSALFTFGSKRASIFRVQVNSAYGDIYEASTGEYNFVGRLLVDNLEPGVQYQAIGYADSEELSSCSFCTLKLPQGEPYARFAVIGDPHISIDRENRRGRLFTESRWLFAETLEQLSNEGFEAVIIPGDVTDRGYAHETDEGQRLLSAFKGEVFLVPGDHDTGREVVDPQNNLFINKLCKQGLPFSVGWKGLRIVGLDTASENLDKQQLAILKEALAGKEPVIIVSHYNLVQGTFISEKTARVANDQETTELLLASKTPWVIYSGHVNIPLTLETSKGWQINTPQILQYPCGFLTVEVYKDGLLHQFVPIKSESLRNYSMRMLGVERSPSFRPGYRYGSLSGRSFFLSWRGIR